MENEWACQRLDQQSKRPENERNAAIRRGNQTKSRPLPQLESNNTLWANSCLHSFRFHLQKEQQWYLGDQGIHDESIYSSEKEVIGREEGEQGQRESSGLLQI